MLINNTEMDFETIFENMSKCVNAHQKTFLPGEFILNYRGKRKIIGILLSGNADLKRIDIKGNETILERLTKGDIFSEMFMEESEDSTYLVSTKKTEVLFIDYHYILRDCKINCHYHNFVLNTIMELTLHKTVDLNHKINILSQRSIREKILAYLKSESIKKGSKTFTIPYSLQELADYLCIDRSAMMRELKNLQDEKKIKKEGRTFTIYKR